MAYLEFVDYVPPAPRARVVREPEPDEAEMVEQSAAPGVTT